MTDFLQEFAEKPASKAKPAAIATPAAKPFPATPARAEMSAPDERRASRRIDVELTAVLRFESEGLECTTSDLSSGGVKLKLKHDMFKNVRINIANFGEISAEIVWKDDEYVGLKFHEDNSEIISALARMTA